MITAPDADSTAVESATEAEPAIPTRARRLSANRWRVRRGFALLLCVALHLGSSAPPAARAANATEVDLALPKAQVLRRTLQSDAQQEYFLYIPSTGGQKAPLFVAVHGISRNATEHAGLFSRYAEAHGVVLVAPFFTEDRHGDYQRLGRAGRGKRADLVLDAIIAEVAAMTGAPADKFYLFGFSGGAQFAHRYAMAHPERVARAVIGAAGWYTFPDASTPYPYGIGASQDLPVTFEPEKFLRVPMTVIVGENDLGSESLRRNQEVDKQQGTTRCERARNWVTAMRAAAELHHLEPIVTYQQVPGIQHSFRQFMLEGQLGDRTFGALFGAPDTTKSRAGDGSEADKRRSERLPPLDAARGADSMADVDVGWR